MTFAGNPVKARLLDTEKYENGELLERFKVRLEMAGCQLKQQNLYHRGLDGFQTRPIATITTCNSRAHNEFTPAFSILHYLASEVEAKVVLHRGRNSLHVSTGR